MISRENNEAIQDADFANDRSTQGIDPAAGGDVVSFARSSANDDKVADLDHLTVVNLETLTATGRERTGETGESGIQITNKEFVAAIFHTVPAGASAAVCTKAGNPASGPWAALVADRAARLSADDNNYVNCSSFYPAGDGSIRARREHFAAYHFVSLDDIGTKIPLDRLKIEPSWVLESSPKNYQIGLLLATPIRDATVAARLIAAVIKAGLCDAGASGPTRWTRLPVATNGKPKHATGDGRPFQCRLVSWEPDRRYSMKEILNRLELDLPPVNNSAPPAKATASRSAADRAGEVVTPRAVENPVVAALKERGLYKAALGCGKHDVKCPWVHEHTDALDQGSAYFEPDDEHPRGGFCCQHSHRETYRLGELLRYLKVSESEALNRDVIRVVEGELDAIVDAAERQLAALGSHFQVGGLIASVKVDPITGDPSIVPTSPQALTRVLSRAAEWKKHIDKKGWVSCDPPQRHTSILYDSQNFRHLKPLSGIARQPYFREVDGSLVVEAGYDPISQRYAVFDPSQFSVPDPTREAAEAALALLGKLLIEFHFVAPTDRAAALSGMLTAVVRPSLPYAPAFHVRAPVMGSGKTYLCEVIGALAGPGGNAKVSYPTTADEATKVILSLLLPSPAVIEFDDMGTDWTPHGIINRMLTAEHITDRILGFSRTATVSTRTLLLGSGNNVGPVRDLLRRVLTIHIDPRCATPATMAYTCRPVDLVRSNRGLYVSAVLTMIQAWLKAGSPRAEVANVATFGGAWSDYCRQPLIWLGEPDPATGLLEQIRHDPDGEALLGLMTEWHKAFGSIPTTVRTAVEATGDNTDLLDAMREFPVDERGFINHKKLGWLLKKNANRIVGEFEFQEAQADGRKAWRVVRVRTPHSPVSPPSISAALENTDAEWDDDF